MKTEKSKKKKHESSSESSSDSRVSSGDSSSDDSADRRPKNRRDSSEDSKEKHRKPNKKSKKRNSDSESSFDGKRKKIKASKHVEKDEIPKPTKEKTTESDSKLKRSRRELESSKWDSPVDKIPERAVKGAEKKASESPPRKSRGGRRSVDRDESRNDGKRVRPERRDRDRFHDERKRRETHDERPRERRYEDDRRDRRYSARDERGSGSRERKNEDRPSGDGGDGSRGRFGKGRLSRRDSLDADYEWGKPGRSDGSDSKRPREKEKPNFGLSGKLTEEVNTYKGVVIKYSEPPEAYKPKRRWRLYPFKGEKAMQTLYIHRETAYLLGRERKVVDIPLDHPSCSKQHAVLQYRLVPFERTDGSTGKRVRPYVIDLGSANGTFLNNVKIESQKYVELFEKDVLKFGYSTREYVLLHENSKDEAQDDDVKEEEVADDDAKSIKKEKLEPMEPIVPQEATVG